MEAGTRNETIVVETQSRAVMEKAAYQLAAEAPAGQASLGSDFGLYKCEACGKMVMGFEKEEHRREKHGAQEIKYRKIR